jgi:hypothetical protein
MVNVGIFYDHLEYCMAIWYNLWPFGIVCGHLLFFPIWIVLTKKNLVTLHQTRTTLFALQSKNHFLPKNGPNRQTQLGK